MTGMSVDEILGRVRRALAERNRAGQQGRADSARDWQLDVWRDLPNPPDAKPEYRLSELLEYADRAFVENAYAAVLRRPADAEGLVFHLNKLRAGALTKVEVLGSLRWSPEGIAKGVHIDGLLLPFKLQQWKRKPFLGPILGWLHGLLHLGATPARAAMTEARLAHQTTELGGHLNRVVAQMSSALNDVSSVLECLRHELAELNQQQQAALAALSGLDPLRHEVAKLQEHQRTAATALSGRVDELQSVVNARAARIEGSVGAIERELAVHRERWTSLDRAQRKQLDEQQALDPLYVAFEQRFRGTPELIRSRVAPYLDILRDAQVGGPAHPVLDVGCGNGDWLDLLREAGMVASGIDSNHMFVELCRGRGLDVAHGDALDHLRGLPDGSVGAVTALHVAEHLPFEELIQLIDECRRVLCIGGVIALETPNPENILVGSHHFYMDPTHRNPLPPEMLRWLVEARGFQMCRIERWTVARDTGAPPMLEPGGPGAASVNAMLAHFHAPLDYAVIGRRL